MQLALPLPDAYPSLSVIVNACRQGLQRLWGYAGGTREQSLALINGVAAQVGSSGLLLEVLGGVCTRFAQGGGRRDNAVACFQAALQGSSKVARTITSS